MDTFRTRLLILARLALLLLAAACSGDADFSGVIETGVLEAGAYRAEITAIDRLLFSDAAIDDQRREAAGLQLEALAARVAKEKPAKFMRLESLELRALAERAKGATSARDLDSLRTNWMRIRNNLFEDQWWFARSAEDLEPAGASGGMITGGETAPDPAPEPGSAWQAREAEHAPDSAAAYVPAQPSDGWDVVEGRWSATAVSIDGRSSGDPELSSSRWTFAGGELAIEGSGKVERFSYSVEGDALRIRSIDAGEAGSVEGWMLYRRTGAVMQVAFHDNLRQRPLGFKPQAEGGDPLVVVVLEQR